jgi:hypothetical protein
MRDNGDDGLGATFWLAVIGICLGAAIAGALLFFLIGWLWAAIGALGAFVVFGSLAVGAGALFDRRERERRRQLAA